VVILFVSCHLSKMPKVIYYAYCNLSFDLVIMILRLYFYAIEIYNFRTGWILLFVSIMIQVCHSLLNQHLILFSLGHEAFLNFYDCMACCCCLI